ncbi:MAG: CPBP family intramembrane metalloprotease [Propionibacteriales bacterium]|nr:CPBP family intramembrane metalloprotease [Propionibacteriales bacterium]
MRIRPNAGIAVGIAIGYMAIVSLLWWVTGLDYTKVAQSPSTIFFGIILPVGVAGIFLVIAASVLGWWRPALFEKKSGRGWMWLAPIFMLLTPLALIGSRDLTKIDPMWALTLAVGVLLVGFGEEMMTRGLGLVGYRGSFSEGWAWFAMSLTFGVMHGLNLLFGQALLPTLQQIGISFVSASVFYVLRRLTGSLIWAMGLHAIFDFGSLVGSTVPMGAGALLTLLSFAQYLAMAIALIAAWRLIVADRAQARGAAAGA